MALPACIELPHVAVARDIAADTGEPTPPLEAAHRLRRGRIDVIAPRPCLIERFFDQEGRPSRRGRIAVAGVGVDVAAETVGALRRAGGPQRRIGWFGIN